MARLRRRTTVPGPWKAWPSELHSALKKAYPAPLRWNRHHQEALGKEGTRGRATHKLAALKRGVGDWEELLPTAPEFFPNILLIDDPIISFLKAFLKLNK